MDRRIKKTKESVRTAYLNLLKEKPAEKITISEIARNANIDRKTFYLHYSSVNDLVNSIFQEGFDDFYEYIGEQGIHENPFNAEIILEGINHLVSHQLSFYQEISKNSNSDFFWSRIRELLSNEIQNHYREKIQTYKCLKVDAEFFSSAIIGAYSSWLRGECSLTIEELKEHVSDILGHGMQIIHKAKGN